VERPAVAEAAEWFVYDHDDLTRALKCSKVGVLYAQQGSRAVHSAGQACHVSCKTGVQCVHQVCHAAEHGLASASGANFKSEMK